MIVSRRDFVSGETAVGDYFSFGEQSAHYFDRPHDGPAPGPIRGQAAWHGDEMRGDPGWRFVLDERRVSELERAVEVAIATGLPTGELKASDFPLPLLRQDLAAWRAELEWGRGFQVISGVPVSRWSEREAEVFFWCFGLHLGRPGAQNREGDLLGHVTDTGQDREDPFVRLYQTSSDIAYHCDAADVVGLLCLRKARSGGGSRIVSSVSVYNALLERRPDLVPRLYEPFHLDVREAKDGDPFRHLPIPPCRHASGRLRTFYHSDYFRSVMRHDDVPRFSDDERALLDLYEEIARDDAMCLEMDLEVGDVQLLSNHTILHARTEYEDWDEPEKRRHLLRLWLSLGAD